jgi:hypothetical protein
MGLGGAMAGQSGVLARIGWIFTAASCNAATGGWVDAVVADRPAAAEPARNDLRSTMSSFR